MLRLFVLLVLMCGVFLSGGLWSFTCPDPQTTSLRDGIPPSPWIINPFSAHRPAGEEGAYFVRANILRAGIGRGVLCTYRISKGDYSILWQAPTKIPAPTDYQWIAVMGGYACSLSLAICTFETLAS
ncbi:MAG: hypothetical protein CK426_01455 [Legionella sp.]|nr:MAG: hypothetical protein CK423_04555 [Legionella sp.]PJD99743.1 MAG: hypothetical protein CK426_01455 [Legionella sp.]